MKKKNTPDYSCKWPGKYQILSFGNTTERTHLHLADVWGANFVNHCYRIVQEHCQKAQIPFSVMRPLLREKAKKIQYMSAQQAQTDPALRAEVKIIEKHLKLTKNERGALSSFERIRTKLP